MQTDACEGKSDISLWQTKLCITNGMYVPGCKLLSCLRVHRYYCASIKCSAECTVIKSNRRVQFRQHSWKLGGVTEHLIEGSK